MVCVYLIGEKIRVEGYEGPEKQEQTPEKEEAGAMEESDCLELYQAELEGNQKDFPRRKNSSVSSWPVQATRRQRAGSPSIT